jgi:tRNA1(Val) A37 N6-methylase TrmN6
VLAAAAVPASPDRDETILDAGAGVGALGLCVAARLTHARVTLVEIDERLRALAERNIARNGLADRVQARAADIAAGGRGIDESGAATGLAPSSFDHVVANPPYFDAARGTPSPDSRKAIAHAMPESGLLAWCKFLAAACRPGGTLTLIHRAEALAALLAALDRRFGALSLLPIHPREHQPASRIIVRGVKGSRAPLRLLPGLVLHGSSGHAFRPEIDQVLRAGARLPDSS